MEKPQPKYRIVAHYKPAPNAVSSSAPSPDDPKPVPFAFTLVNNERQRETAFRLEHGMDGRKLSGRQFKRARKRGNRLAREQAKAA